MGKGCDELNIEDSIEFLQTVGVEMKTQEHDSQAEPRFWVVAENKREFGIDDGYADGEVACGTDGETYDTVEEFIEFLVENEYLFRDDIEEDYDYDFEEIINLLDDSDFHTCGYRDEPNSIVPDTFFITKAECKQHISLNHYHYKNPHTYAMTAWRSPQVEMLYEILQNTDWEYIKQAVLEKKTRDIKL